MTPISAEQARGLIEQMVDKMGSQREVARFLKISPAYLSDILNGRRDISDEVAKKLGYEKEIMYAPIN